MNDDLRAHINRATDALAALEITATHLNAAAKEAIDADTALRTAKAMMDDCESALLLEAVRLGVLDGKNAETRDAQLREYRNQSIDWDGVTSAHHEATVSAARARQQAESAAAGFSAAKEALRLHTAILALIGRA